MNISFIGAGKVGTSLGIYLKKNNFNVLGYYSRSFSSSEKASNLTNSIAFKTLKATLKADIIFITVNDDSIKEVAMNISRLNINLENKIFVHMSGALSSCEIGVLKRETTDVVSLHPIQAFADVSNSVEQLQNTTFSIEGGDKAIQKIKNILDKCSNPYFILEENQKSLYHASACVVSNYLVTLLDYGFSILKHIGIPEELAINSFFPLIEANINNIKKSGTEKSLTGPIARGDLDTIKKHLEAFKENDFNNTHLYKVMGDYTISLAQKDKLKNNKKALQISKLLEENEYD